MNGRLIAFVGPSGVGKDSLMEALAARHGLRQVRRVITRPSDAGGEAFEGVSEAEFTQRAAAGQFALSWQAHGLQYGIPHAQIGGDEDRLINLSRAVLPEAQTLWPTLVVILVTAPPDILRARLLQRGREDAAEVDRRLARASQPMPEGVRYTELSNAGTLEQSLDTLDQLLYPASAAR